MGVGIRFGIAEQNMAMMSSALTQDVYRVVLDPFQVLEHMQFLLQ